MITFYGTDPSHPANKVRFVLNYLNLNYDYVKLNLRAGDQKTPSFLAINPAGKVPALSDDGFSLFESTAIIRYLAEKNTSPIYPAELKARTIVNMWTDYASHHISPNIGRLLFNRIIAPMVGAPADENSIKDGITFLNAALPVLNNQLEKNKMLAGTDISIADFALLAHLDPAEAVDYDLTPYKAVVAWRKDLQAKEFYQKCYKSYADVVNALKNL